MLARILYGQNTKENQPQATIQETSLEESTDKREEKHDRTVKPNQLDLQLASFLIFNIYIN
jgi:hypothetical protein